MGVVWKGGGTAIDSHLQILRAAAFCCGIPNIPNQIKVAESTRDLSGLVRGSAGVRQLRPKGQRPVRSGLSKELAPRHVCRPLPFSPGILQACG